MLIVFSRWHVYDGRVKTDFVSSWEKCDEKKKTNKYSCIVISCLSTFNRHCIKKQIKHDDGRPESITRTNMSTPRWFLNFFHRITFHRILIAFFTTILNTSTYTHTHWTTLTLVTFVLTPKCSKKMREIFYHLTKNLFILLLHFIPHSFSFRYGSIFFCPILPQPHKYTHCPSTECHHVMCHHPLFSLWRKNK